MKQFNLEKALAGEPVRLRNGWKAYVKYVMPELYKGLYPIRGFCIKPDNDVCELCWTLEGKDTSAPMTSDLDIVSMWEEPQPRVTLTLPCPLKEPQENMWYIENGVVNRSMFTETNKNYSKDGLEKGFYFATKEDAEEWLDVIKGVRK